MLLPYIFDIKRTSTHDGPGIRTVAFFKGCNLDCFWCHNPEGKRANPEVAVFTEKCISCGACGTACGAESVCTDCGACVEVCPEEARKLYGRRYSLDELMSILLRDLPYFCMTGGGVTLSGGECMLYPEAVCAIGKRCREAGTTLAVDTAGNVPWESFLRVLPDVDLFLYDIKALDPDLHKRGTGVDPQRILTNLDRLVSAGARIIVRIPAIPSFNEGEEVERIKAYCEARGLPYEVLSYHAYGESKREALNVEKLPQKHR